MDDKSKKYFLKGFGHLINQDYDKALEDLKEVVMQNTHMVEMYVALGTLYRNKGEYLKAIHIHESAVGEKNIKDDLKKQILHELVLDYKLSGQYDKALFNLNNLLKMDKSPVLFKLLASLYFDKGDYESAIKSYLKYSKLSKKDVSKEIANCYYKLSENQSDIKKRIKLLKKSLGYFAAFRLASYKLLEEYATLKNKKLIYEQIKNIINYDIFYSLDDLNKVSNIYFDDDKLDVFVKECIKKVSQKNKNPLYYLFLANYFSKKGELDKAKSLLADYISDGKRYNIVLEKYLELINEPVLKSVVSDRKYICEKCKETYLEYYDICPKCGGIQTIYFN